MWRINRGRVLRWTGGEPLSWLPDSDQEQYLPRGHPVAHVMWDGDARTMYGDEGAEGVAWVASRLMAGFQRGGWALRVEMRRRMAWETSRIAVTTTSAS